MPEAFPRLRRDIDAAPATRDAENYYILYDRSGIAGSRLLVSPLGLLIAGRLDGTASILDISDILSRELGGEGIACAEVEKIIAALDEAFFLDDSRFRDFLSQAERDFRAMPLRSAVSAGSAYSDDPALLEAELDRILAEAPPAEEQTGRRYRHPRGIIVPHLDFSRGAPGYGQAYRLLAESPAPQTVVVIGTAHTPLSERLSLCDKDFDTPLGAIRVDHDLAKRLRRATHSLVDLDADLLAHRGEHSIELQAVWLRKLYGDDVRIVPLLASSLGEFIDGERQLPEAAEDPMLRAAAECLSEATAGEGVMVMASADLAHVGPRFGDIQDVTNQFLSEVEDIDRDYLDAVAAGPIEGLASLASHGDRYHVCGSASIFLLGLALLNAKTRLLGYHQAVTPEMSQAVTYAAMVFE